MLAYGSVFLLVEKDLSGFVTVATLLLLSVNEVPLSNRIQLYL